MNAQNKKFLLVNSFAWGLFTFINTGIQLWAQGSGRGAVIFSSLILGLFLWAITVGFRNYAKKHQWRSWRPRRLLLPILLAVILMTILADVGVVILIQLANLFFKESTPISFEILFVNFINISLVFFMWAAIYFAYQYFQKYNRAEVEKLALKLQVKEAELGVLKSQINPHFMFNALNNIRALILENQEQARTMLTHLSDILRYSLSYTESEKVSLESELEIVRYYFELASIQYEDRLKYSISVPDDLRQIKIPPMLIQLLVENGIKHGISVLPKGGNIEISIKKEGDLMKIKVSNTGTLDPSRQGVDKMGIGLLNIRERLRLLYNEKAGFDLRQLGGEVVAEVVLPG